MKISEQSTIQRQVGNSARNEGGILFCILSFGSQVTPFLLACAKRGRVSWNHLLAVQGLIPNTAAMALYEIFNFIFIRVRATLSLFRNFLGSYFIKDMLNFHPLYTLVDSLVSLLAILKV